jgi:flagellar assembly protein FliH
LSKKFVSDKMIAGEVLSEPAYKMVWHSLGRKEYSSAFLEQLKEVEAKVLKQAKEKALHIEQEAYEKGFAQGEKDGLELGQKRIETIVQQIRTVLQEMENQREPLYRVYEREMLQLALSISKKILHHECQVNEDVITATLREVSKYIVDQRKIVIRLNPADAQFIQSHPNKATPVRKGRQGVELLKDPSITRGGCVVETAFGGIDATMETQFDQIVSLLWERFNEPGEPSSREES